VKVSLPVMVIKATFTLKYVMLEKNILATRHHGITSKLNDVLGQFMG